MLSVVLEVVCFKMPSSSQPQQCSLSIDSILCRLQQRRPREAPS